MLCNRHYFRWNINELIALQREYELLELSIIEIAIRHKRSVRSILCRLQEENFIQDWSDAKGYNDYLKSSPELNFYTEINASGSEISSIVSSDVFSSHYDNDQNHDEDVVDYEENEEDDEEDLPHYRLDLVDLKKEKFDLFLGVKNFFKNISKLISINSEESCSEL